MLCMRELEKPLFSIEKSCEVVKLLRVLTILNVIAALKLVQKHICICQQVWYYAVLRQFCMINHQIWNALLHSVPAVCGQT